MTATIQAHVAMTLDQVRVGAYAQAIQQVVNPGTTVLDFGAGTGILTLLAAKAGADVIAVEACDKAAGNLQRLVRENGLDQQVTVIRDSRRICSECKEVDCVIWELLSPSGCDEYDMRPLQDIRDNCLRSGGVMIPDRVEHCVQMWSQPQAYVHSLAGAYGLKWDSLVSSLSGLHFGMDVSAGKPSAAPDCWFDLDVRLAPLPSSLCAQSGFLEQALCRTATGVVSFFNAYFNKTLMLSTHPYSPLTLWQHHYHPLARKLDNGRRVRYAFGYGVENNQRVYRLCVETV